MFSFFDRKARGASDQQPSASDPPAASRPHPGANPANPGMAVRGKFAFNDGQRSWEETFDCIQILARELENHGHRFRVEGDLIAEDSTGLSFRPLLVDLQPIHGKGVRTVTTIEITRLTIMPNAIFEFQHATGGTTLASITSGFGE
jgi:hypothetical protein